MIQAFKIYEKLPSLNEYINLCRRNKYQANKFKTDIEKRIRNYIYCGQLVPVKKCRIEFHWIEPDKRRDLDNIISAKKFILDSLQEAKIIQTDGQRHVCEIRDFVRIDKGVEEVRVIIEEV